MSELVKRTE